MTATHKQTTDAVQLQKVIERLFLNAPCYLRDTNGDTPTRVLRRHKEFIEIQYPGADARLRLLTLEHGSHRFLVECSIVKRLAQNEWLKPLRLHIWEKPNAQPRLKIAGNGGPVITGCVPVAVIPAMLSSMDARRDAILRVYASAVQERFPDGSAANIVLRRSNRQDHRMRPLIAQRKSLFAPHRYEEDLWITEGDPRFVPLADYRKIRAYDMEIPKSMAGEISEPLWFRSLYLYGYIHLLTPEALNLEQYESVAALARKLEQDLEGYDALPKNTARCVVDDLSHTGVGFLYPHHSPYLKNLMPGEEILFDMLLPAGDRLNFGGVILNVKNQESAYRFGVQVTACSHEHRAKLDEYLAERAAGRAEPAGGDP